jgi:hypothetical protein
VALLSPCNFDLPPFCAYSRFCFNFEDDLRSIRPSCKHGTGACGKVREQQSSRMQSPLLSSEPALTGVNAADARVLHAPCDTLQCLSAFSCRVWSSCLSSAQQSLTCKQWPARYRWEEGRACSRPIAVEAGMNEITAAAPERQHEQPPCVWPACCLLVEACKQCCKEAPDRHLTASALRILPMWHTRRPPQH